MTFEPNLLSTLHCCPRHNKCQCRPQSILFKRRKLCRDHLLLALFSNFPTCIGVMASTVKVTEFDRSMNQSSILAKQSFYSDQNSEQCNVRLCVAQRKNILKKFFFTQIPDRIGISRFHLAMRISSWGSTLKNKTNKPKTTFYRIHFHACTQLCIVNVISEISGSPRGRRYPGCQRVFMPGFRLQHAKLVLVVFSPLVSSAEEREKNLWYPGCYYM